MTHDWFCGPGSQTDSFIAVTTLLTTKISFKYEDTLNQIPFELFVCF